MGSLFDFKASGSNDRHAPTSVGVHATGCGSLDDGVQTGHVETFHRGIGRIHQPNRLGQIPQFDRRHECQQVGPMLADRLPIISG